MLSGDPNTKHVWYLMVGKLSGFKNVWICKIKYQSTLLQLIVSLNPVRGLPNIGRRCPRSQQLSQHWYLRSQRLHQQQYSSAGKIVLYVHFNEVAQVEI